MGRYLDKVRCFAYIQGNCSHVDEARHVITGSCRIYLSHAFWGSSQAQIGVARLWPYTRITAATRSPCGKWGWSLWLTPCSVKFGCGRKRQEPLYRGAPAVLSLIQGRRNERKRWIFGEHPRRGTSGSSSSSERCKNGLRIRLANGSSSSFPDTSETRSYLVGDTLNLW